MLSITLYTADTGLSRFDHSLLTDQMRMEILISEMPENVRTACQDAEGMYTDAKTWKNVTTEAEHIIALNWACTIFHGPTQMHALPQNLKTINLSRQSAGCKFSGTIDTETLPDSLGHAFLDSNNFYGNFDFSRLPLSLKALSINGNVLSGTIDLENLPDGLKQLWATDNKFTGEINLTALPLTLEHITLGGNALTGDIDMTKLPAQLKNVDLSRNQLSGSVDLGSLPASLMRLLLHGNVFVGSVRIDKLPNAMQYLNISQNQFTALIYDGTLPPQIRSLDCSGNPLQEKVQNPHACMNV